MKHHKTDVFVFFPETDNRALLSPLISLGGTEKEWNVKQTHPPWAILQHLPLKVTASSHVTSPCGRQVGDLIVFTCPSRNLAAANVAIAGGHQESARASFAREKRDELEDRFVHWALQWQIRKSHFIFSFHIPLTCSDCIHIQAWSDLYGRIWWKKGEQKRMTPADLKWRR